MRNLLLYLMNGDNDEEFVMFMQVPRSLRSSTPFLLQASLTPSRVAAAQVRFPAALATVAVMVRRRE